MKKRLTAITLTLSLCLSLFLLTSCMSSEQQQIAKENEDASKTLAEEYLKSNYGGGTVNSLTCITYTGSLGNRKASEYVRAAVTAHDKDFYILINTKSEQCLDNYNTDKVKKAIEQRASDLLSGETPTKVTASIFSDSLSDSMKINDCEGYLSADDKTMEDIFASGAYSISVTCSYIDSEADFLSIDASAFIPESSNIKSCELTYKNYRNDALYRSNNSCDPYSLKSKLVSSFDGETGENISSYSNYGAFSANGVDIYWDETKLSLDFSETEPVSQIRHEEYEGLIFTPKLDTAVDINYTVLDQQENGGELFLFFNSTNYGNYGILTDLKNTYNPNIIWKIDSSRTAPTQADFSFGHDSGSFTLGIYRGEEQSVIADFVDGFSEQK